MVKVRGRHYRTLDGAEEEYYRHHPDEIDDYLQVAFADYAKEGYTPALTSQLRMIARVKGISQITRESDLTRNGVQKTLSESGNPKFENITAILGALGYQLVPQRLELQPV